MVVMLLPLSLAVDNGEFNHGGGGGGSGGPGVAAAKAVAVVDDRGGIQWQQWGGGI